jgi:ABC-2 type transport system ATP-binding protein
MMMDGQEEIVARFDDVQVLFRSRIQAPVWALRGFSLSVPKGAVMGLLGPNGAGKTTCISCLLGLIDPHVGGVYLWGQRVSAANTRQIRRCGALLEDTRLPPFLSVLAALRAVCALRGVQKPATELDRVLALCSVGDLRSRTVATLSKGQARRVGLAAALIGDPALLVLDEPSAGLDAEARVEFEALVQGLRDGQRTMLVASHLLGDVETTCSHIAVVQSGHVVLSGRSRDLLQEARRGQASDVHVDAASAPALAGIGISHEPSRYPSLVVLRSDLPEEDLFAALARARVIPRRVEPRVSVLSVYLEATRKEDAT